MSVKNGIDIADDRAVRRGTRRSITLPGKSATFASTDPIAIARALRAQSELGEAERKLDRD